MTLRVENLSISLRSAAAGFTVVEGVSFEIDAGRTFALVGESGCGKTLTSLAIPRLLPPVACIESGRIVFEGRDLCAMSESELTRIRGARIGVVFQDPFNSLNPVLTIGAQLAESLRLHKGLSARQAARRAVELLRQVRIAQPERRLYEFPHLLSGGMRQRVVLAMALACEPSLLIADEPTTALDVTVQAGILRLLADLQRGMGLAILLVTHDLGVVSHFADEVGVMYAGRIVERAAASALLARPAHPYTRALLACLPLLSGGGRSTRLAVIPGEAPSPARRPSGCVFHPRCPEASSEPRCQHESPMLETMAGESGRRCACWLADALPAVATGEGAGPEN